MRRALDNPGVVLAALLLSLGAGVRGPIARAQGTVMRPIPETPLPTDVDEVEEVDADEVEPAPGGEGSAKRLETEATRLDEDERRGRYSYLVSAFVGQAMPWQTWGLAADAVLKPDLTAGMFAGGGAYSLEGGIVNQKSFDLRIHSRVLGVQARYHFHNLDVVSVGASLGYATWDGRVTPQGSDDEVTDDSSKLTASFRASGLVAGTSVALGWLWDNGVYVEWTLLGLQRSRASQKDFSRDTDAVHDAVLRNVEGTRVFGLYDVKLGYFF